MADRLRAGTMAVAICVAIVALGALGVPRAAMAVARAQRAGWPMYRGDRFNDGAVPGPGAVRSLTLTPLWSYRAASRMSSTPTVADGLVFTGTWQGHVVALDAHTGKLRWRRSLGANPDPVYGGPRGVIGAIALDDGVAYAVSGSCFAAAFAVRNGRRLWRRQICSTAKNDDTYASPVVYGREVLFGIDQLADRPTDHGREIALDRFTGRELWSFSPVRYGGTGAGISATPAIDKALGLAYVGTGNPTPANHLPPGPDRYSESLCALDPRNGRLAWAYGPVHPHDSLDRDLFASPNLFDVRRGAATVRVVGEAGKDDDYYAWDARTGRLLWKRRLVPFSKFAMVIGTPAIGTGRIFVPVYQNQRVGWLVALNAATGHIDWRIRASGFYEAPVLWGDVLFATQTAGWLDAYAAPTGKRLGRWRIDTPVYGRGPSVAADVLYEASGQRLVAFRLTAR